MTRCLDCRNRRRFARDVSRTWWSPFRVCYRHWLRRRARLHIAGRVALVLLFVAFMFGPLMWRISHALGWL